VFVTNKKRFIASFPGHGVVQAVGVIVVYLDFKGCRVAGSDAAKEVRILRQREVQILQNLERRGSRFVVQAKVWFVQGFEVDISGDEARQLFCHEIPSRVDDAGFEAGNIRFGSVEFYKKGNDYDDKILFAIIVKVSPFSIPKYPPNVIQLFTVMVYECS